MLLFQNQRKIANTTEIIKYLSAEIRRRERYSAILVPRRLPSAWYTLHDRCYLLVKVKVTSKVGVRTISWRSITCVEGFNHMCREIQRLEGSRASRNPYFRFDAPKPRTPLVVNLVVLGHTFQATLLPEWLSFRTGGTWPSPPSNFRLPIQTGQR